MAESVWTPGWNDRILKRVEQLGFSNLSDCLRSLPGKPYEDVVRDLEFGAAPIQLLQLQCQEAKAANQLRRAAMDSFARFMRHRLPDGWNATEEARQNSPLAFGAWSSSLVAGAGCKEYEREVQSVLKNFESDSIPKGWIPTGPDDPVIVQNFDKYWPQDSLGNSV